MTPAVGMRFGRYELLQKLGAGGMGEVYRARDHDLGRDVAVKFLPERFASDPDRLGRLAKEARTASQLNHPNIVTIHEIGETEGLRFIVMELVEGRTLRELLSNGPLVTRPLLDLAVQIADGLAKAHAVGIVHRDLKPENLMVTDDGIVKILDFGLAKFRAPQSGSGPDVVDGDASTRAVVGVSASSAEGFVVGTVGYMSPEQAAGRAVDYRSDQFALGAIIYEMATGRRAFKRDTPVQTLSAIIEADPEPLATLNPSFPPQARWLVERCLAKTPADRYTSTADLARELRNVREHLTESGAGGQVVPRPVPWYRRWASAFGILATVLVVVFAVPSLREGILGPLQLLPLPGEKRIAVLPFRATTAEGDDQPLCDGLFEFLIARLGQLERFQQAAWVVPAVEVRQSGVTTADGARRALGATVVVTGSLQRTPAGLVVTASVIDATTLRQLRATTFEVGQASLLERTVDAVVGMLDLELSPEALATLRAGGTGVVEASTLYAQALGYTPYSQARTALQRYDQERNLERAIELFNQALERDPRYALARAGLGEAYWRLSRFTKKPEHVSLAEQHCRRALEIDPLVAQAWVAMGMIHAGTGRAEEALQDFQRALDRDPRNAEAHRELASVYARLGRKEDTEATYRKAIELRPDDWVTYNQFGAYLYSRNAAEAEVVYKRALELVPDNARVWSGLGAAYYFQEKTADAVKAWTRSVELFPTYAAVSNLGTQQFFEGRYAEAARTYEQALKIDERDYRVWRNLAAARLWAPGEHARAREAFTRAAELAEQERKLEPLNALTHADLADCYANLGEPAKARAAAADAARLGSDQSDVARLLGEAYEQMGDRTAAIEWLGKALDLGLPPNEIEQAPGLAKLRADPRYQSLVTREKAAHEGAGK